MSIDALSGPTFGCLFDVSLSPPPFFFSPTLSQALDVEAIVTYNSFDSLSHYYSEMSAMGDRVPEFHLLGPASESASSSLGNNNEWGRIGNVSTPLAVLQALDDPLVGWRTVGTANPQGLADSGSGNVMLLLTKAGGHVVRMFFSTVIPTRMLPTSYLHSPSFSFSLQREQTTCIPVGALFRVFFAKYEGMAVGQQPCEAFLEMDE